MASPSSGPMQTPPFLTKLYQLVNDPTTNDLVSWTDATGLSFTVHKPSEFGRDVLPKYFKHNNFSSFVRQLNQYGFHKQNPDRWMFGHDRFRRDRPDLLKNITRRRPKQQLQQQNLQNHQHDSSSPSQAIIAPGLSLSSKAVVELGNYGIEGEVKALKRDKDLLIKELVVTRQAEEKLKDKCDNLESRMQTMESTSKQMQAFIMHYFSQVLQPYSEAMASRKRKRLTGSSPSDMVDIIGDTAGPSRATVQPMTNPPPPAPSVDALRVMMQQMQMNMARTPTTPLVQPPPPVPQPALVEAGNPGGAPASTYEPATVQELPQDEILPIPMSNSPSGQLIDHVTVSGLKHLAVPNGYVSIREPDEGHGDVLDFLEELPATPNSSLTMEAIESALKEPHGKPNGRTHLDTPHEMGKDCPPSLAGISKDIHGSQCEEEQRAIEDFLELDTDDTPLPPPLTHLPEGTDVHALALRIEGFQEQAAAAEADA